MRGGASESLQDLPLHFHYFKNRLKITPKNTVVLMHPNQTPVFYVVDVKGLSTFPSWTSRVRVPSPAPTFQSLAHLAKSALVSFVSIKARWLRFYFNGSVSKRQTDNTASIRYRGAPPIAGQWEAPCSRPSSYRGAERLTGLDEGSRPRCLRPSAPAARPAAGRRRRRSRRTRGCSPEGDS